MHFAVGEEGGKGRKGERKGRKKLEKNASLEINFWLRSCSELMQKRDQVRMVEVLNSY